MNPLKKALLDFIEPQRLLEGEPMGEHTTFRVGGRAELCFFPRSGEEIARGLAAAEAAGAGADDPLDPDDVPEDEEPDPEVGPRPTVTPASAPRSGR